MKKTAFERFTEWKQSKPKNDIQLQARIDEIEHELNKMKRAAVLKEKKIETLKGRIHIIESRIEFALKSVIWNKSRVDSKVAKRMIEKFLEE